MKWKDNVPLADARCEQDKKYCVVHWVRQQPGEGVVEIEGRIPQTDVPGDNFREKEFTLQDMLGGSEIDANVEAKK
ncbi:MAG: hypothetical protein ACOCQD_01855 [archaeon]